MDELEKRVKTFFSECRKYQKQDIPPNLEDEYQGIRKEYYKSLEDADEKVPTSDCESFTLITAFDRFT